MAAGWLSRDPRGLGWKAIFVGLAAGVSRAVRFWLSRRGHVVFALGHVWKDNIHGTQLKRTTSGRRWGQYLWDVYAVQ